MKLILMQRDFLFNLGDEFEGYTVIYKEDFSGSGSALEIECWNEDEEISDPIFINELKDKIRMFIYSPQNIEN